MTLLLREMNLHKTFKALLMVLALSGTVAQAQDMESDYEASPDIIKLHGFGEMDHISYFENPSDGKIYGRNQALLHFNVDSRAGNKARLFANIEAREDFSDRSRSRFFIQEAYADVFLNKLDLRIGKQIVTWGAADAINYTSNINPVNFTDLLDLRYQILGVYSIKADYYLKKWKLTGVVIPVFTPSVLPGQNSPWSPVLPESIPNPFVPGAQFSTSYEMAAPELPANDIRSAQYAARAATSLGKADISFSYYNGYNDLPIQFIPTANPVSMDSVHIQLRPDYRAWQVIGADFASFVGKFGVRGEAAYFITDNKNETHGFVVDPYLQYVLGIDRRFNKFFVLFQWLHEVTSNGQQFSYQDLNHVFQKSVMARFELSIGDYTKLAVKGIYNIAAEDYYIRPEINFEISSGLNLTLLADILEGSEQGFFGQYRNNDRVQARIKYNF